MQPFPIKVQPGIVTDASPYALRGRFIASDKIRFNLGQPQSIGGWERTLNGNTIQGICRTLYPFGNLLGQKSLFLGTTSLAYVWYITSALYDITPVYSVTNFANPISTTITSNRVGVTINPGDPKIIGSHFSISGSAAVGGIPAVQINAAHIIVAVVGNTIYFDVVAVASSTVPAGGGAVVTVTLLWPSGYADPVTSGGWGSGGWGSGGWGGSGLSAINPIRFWSCDTWGEDLIISPSDGPIFYWDATTPSARALPISGMVGASQVPIIARQVLVTEQNRIVVAFGVNAIGSGVADPKLIRWSDNENYLEWSPAVAGSAAGEKRLVTGTVFVAAIEAPNETLVFTDAGLEAMSPSGDNEVFNLRVVTPRANVYGPRAMVIAGDALFWWGTLGFTRYAGSVTRLECPIEEYITQIMDNARQTKTYCGSNSAYNEVWWFFVSVNSPDGEPDMYVKLNYVDNLWDFGTMDRTAWKDADIFPKPIAVTPTGIVLYHEVGTQDATDPMAIVPFTSSLGTGPIMIDNVGGGFIATRYLVPDVEFITNDGSPGGGMEFTPTYSRGPGDINPVPGPSFTVSNDTDVSRYRMRGRGQSVAFEITCASGDGFRLGELSIIGLKDGKK